MFRWLTRIWETPVEADAVDPADRLRAEIRRLDGLVLAYRDFGFDAMASDCACRKAALQQELRRLRRRDGAAG